MGNAVKSIFGGTDRSAQRNTLAQNEMSRDYIQQQAGNAQNFLAGAIPQMQRASGEGFGSAFDLMNQVAPAQINATQQGNLAAQNYLIGGMPAFQNALMGMPIDYSQFRPTTISAQIPQAQMSPILRGMGQQQPMMQQQPIDYSQLLSGMVR